MTVNHFDWIFHLPELGRSSFWSVLHEARADFDVLPGALDLLIECAGARSLDARLAGGSGPLDLPER